MYPATDRIRQTIRYPVQLAGSYACRALESNFSWKVLAVFKQGFYCQNRVGDLIFIASLSIRPGPLNILCRVPDPVNWVEEGLTPESAVDFDGETIRIDNCFVFTCQNVRQWQPKDISKEWALDVIAERISVLSAEAHNRELSDGLGPLILFLFRTEQRPTAIMTHLIKMAWGSAERLSEWLSSEFSGRPIGISAIRNEIRTLIGLGPGLTPAGDDFLGGILITLYALGREDLSQKLAHYLLPMARVRTGKISFAHLLCASQGQGHDALHQTISMLSVKRETRLRAILRTMDTVGHTSGWDALAGVALVFKSLLAVKEK
ncbi:MAG: DUF2877 domain-containing protein [Desulfobacterales bacterium]|nr:DUF2877 domain-containing protein [Desulfobacterales bacterium]